VLERLTPYIYKIKLQRVIFTANHDRLKACRDRKIPVWLQKCQAKLNRGECVIQSKDQKERKKLTDPIPLDIDLALSWTRSLLSSWSLSLPLSTSSLALNHCSDILK
jgi:hypothetical protein